MGPSAGPPQAFPNPSPPSGSPGSAEPRAPADPAASDPETLAWLASSGVAAAGLIDPTVVPSLAQESPAACLALASPPALGAPSPEGAAAEESSPSAVGASLGTAAAPRGGSLALELGVAWLPSRAPIQRSATATPDCSEGFNASFFAPSAAEVGPVSFAYLPDFGTTPDGAPVRSSAVSPPSCCVWSFGVDLPSSPSTHRFSVMITGGDISREAAPEFGSAPASTCVHCGSSLWVMHKELLLQDSVSTLPLSVSVELPGSSH
mmetsp:Transcript_4042/g.9648  ORF Transcript_4042/g.9648 Transcript_4042/m.9648 type:complete len:263 (-) Transcript_4042:801-1589(-)